jgi:esterase/lipase superfamily enzyme
MGHLVSRQTPKGMPSAVELSKATEQMAKKYFVVGSRAVRTQENRLANPAIHQEFRFVEGGFDDASFVKTQLKDKHLVIFVHGYNVTTTQGLRSSKEFFSSLAQAIQDKQMTPLEDVSFCLFTWPGDTGAIYFNDAQVYAQYSGVALYKFLIQAHDAGVTSFSLAGHSLGVHVMLRALAVLGQRRFTNKIQYRVKAALLLAAAVEDDVFRNPDRTEEYHFPESAFGLESLHIIASRDDEVLAGPFWINEADRALGFTGPESMEPLASLARRVREVLGEKEEFRFEVHDFSSHSATILNPNLWVDNHGDYWSHQDQMDYYVNLLI